MADIVALGLDIVDLDRIGTILERHGDAFLARVFTERERAWIADDGDPVARVAARFAAKEAALKALGTGWGEGVGWHDVEVVGGRGSPPSLELGGAAAERMASLGARRALVSITHARSVAGATVVLS